jgi:hypothetical protein
MQAMPKRNIAGARPCGRNQVQTMGCARQLFDRDGQPGDQPRHFVELFGIVIPDRPRKPGETFVVAHCWHIARDDRRYCTVGLNDRHQITSRIVTGKASIVPE